MHRERIKEFFKQYDSRVQNLVDTVLGIEQEYISYELKTNNKQSQEIKQSIKQIIDRMSKDNEA